MSPDPGRVVILNGAPRSGKSSTAAALQQREGAWVALGVDSSRASTPPHLQPGIGLRPGGERPELEPAVGHLLHALHASVAATARTGLDVVVDVGHHTAYASDLDPWRIAAHELAGLDVLTVGVRCPEEVLLERRARTWGEAAADLAAVQRWEHAVHTRPYDVEIDTSQVSPAEAAEIVLRALAEGRAKPLSVSSR